MSRIVIFGDSYSYGDGLADPLKQNYGHLLGVLAHKEVINKAISGSSNTRIAYEVLNFDFEPNDVVLIGWSYACREMLAIKNTEIQNLGTWIDDSIKLNRAWLEYLCDEHDLAIKSFMHMHHINTYLTNKNINYIQYWFEELPEMFDLKTKYFWADTIKMDVDLFKEIQPVDLTSCNHPGPKSHKLFAYHLFKNFKEIIC